MRLIITADLTPISERLTNLSKQMSDLKPVMSAVGGILESSTRLRISNQKKMPVAKNGQHCLKVLCVQNAIKKAESEVLYWSIAAC